jgi:type I restriction enzyme M protein
LIENDLVDCMVALPGQLFYSTQIPVCLWFLARDRKNHKFRDRRGETLFIDGRKMGKMVDRSHAEITAEEIDKISATYHAWRGDKGAGKYQDVKGFCKSATLEEMKGHGYILTPGRYVGAEDLLDEESSIEERLESLGLKLIQHFNSGADLSAKIMAALAGMGMKNG